MKKTMVNRKKKAESQKNQNLWAKISFIFIGLVSTIWFLIRVIPKPSRAAYPCMRAAAPFASSFVLYLLSLVTSVTLFRKGKKLFQKSKYSLGILILLAGVIIGAISLGTKDEKVYAISTSDDIISNDPIGNGKGVMPGRVVWGHDPGATNENYTPTDTYWYDDENTNPEVVKQMVSDVLKKLTEAESDEEAWDKIFKYYNTNHGKGDVAYVSGEKIVIKVNLNSNRSKYGSGKYVRSKKENIDTSPQIILAVLDQLVNKAGVLQEDISIGDPGRNFDDVYFEICTRDFPDVHYWGEGNGRTPHKKTEEKVLFASNGEVDDWLPQCYVDAEYMINIPVFKKHHRAGISLACKNHFGTFVTSSRSAAHWHFSLPAANGKGDVCNPGYGLYRCFVDIMGHKDLGGKTVLYLIDGLWSSTNNANPPVKWSLEPFNNDYPSSVFASIDPVAIESVGFDFLYAEFNPDHPVEGAYDPEDNKGPFPHYSGVDDYLRQAADSTLWPENISYDPEGDGISLPRSLGVNEHWNNSTEKKYSRNLGEDQGIELVYLYSNTQHTGIDHPETGEMQLRQNYPNPFSETTTIDFTLYQCEHVKVSVYNLSGQLIVDLVNQEYPSGTYSLAWDGNMDSGQKAGPGIYLCKMNTGTRMETILMTLQK